MSILVFIHVYFLWVACISTRVLVPWAQGIFSMFLPLCPTVAVSWSWITTYWICDCWKDTWKIRTHLGSFSTQQALSWALLILRTQQMFVDWVQSYFIWVPEGSDLCSVWFIVTQVKGENLFRMTTRAQSWRLPIAGIRPGDHCLHTLHHKVVLWNPDRNLSEIDMLPKRSMICSTMDHSWE